MIEASTRSARHGRSPAGAVAVPATERAKQIHTARLLGRSNELLHASRAFSAWVGAIRERRLQTHLKRCSAMLKHHSLRHEYTRCFMRWFAFTQRRASETVRSAIRLRKDVPLRSKADFLALAHRYFAKWRAILRERKQRTVTNVKLLEVLNKERLRSRTLLKWWRFHHMQISKHHAAEIAEREDSIVELQRELQKAVHETKRLRNQLDAALQQQSKLRNDLEVSRDSLGGSEQHHQTEVNELREAMREAVKLLEGPSSVRLRSLQKWGITSARPRNASDALTPPNSARQSKDTAEALLAAVNGALVSLASAAKVPVPPASLEECISDLHERLRKEAREAAAIRAQRDELASAAQTTRVALAVASSLRRVDAPADSDRESSCDPSSTISLVGATPNAFGLPSACRTTGSGRRSAAAVVACDHSSSATSTVSGATPPRMNLPATPTEMTCIDLRKLPRLLIQDAKAVVSAMQTAHQDVKRSADEVKDLQDAALRAIDALGGRGATNTEFMAKSQESVEARASRSGNIADSLRNLCEDMIVVLVLTSLWSGKCASERVSEALERLWHRTQDLEANRAKYLQQLEQYAAVVHTSVAILRSPSPTRSSAMSRRARSLLARRQPTALSNDTVAASEQVDVARRSAEELAAKGDGRPTELIELCLQAQQRAAAEQPTVPAKELRELLKSAREMIVVTVGKTRSEELGVGFSAPAAHTSRPSGFVVAPEASYSVAGGSEMPRSGSVDSPAAEEVAAALKAAVVVATAALSRSDGVVENSLVDGLARSWAQARELQEQLADAAARNKANERALQKRLVDFDKGRNAVERSLQRQLQALEHKAEQSALQCRKLEAELNVLKEDNKAKDVALQGQTVARENVRREHAEAMRRLCEEVESLRRQLAAVKSENSASSDTIERLRRQLKDLQRRRADCDAVAAELEATRRTAQDAMETAAAAQQELRARLSAAEKANRKSNAIGVFLRDVLRDCVTRLHQLACSVGDLGTSEQSPRASLALKPAHSTPPPMLARGSDPSEYVEYVLRLGGNDSMGRRLVQEHLRESVGVHGLQALNPGGGVARLPGADSATKSGGGGVGFHCADPSTWEVVAELHNGLALLFDCMAQMNKSAAEQRTRAGELAKVKDQATVDVLAALVELKPWSSVAAAAAHEEQHLASSSSANSAGSSLSGIALLRSCAEVARALEEMRKVAVVTRPLIEVRSTASSPRRASARGALDMLGAEAAATERLLSLVADVQDMAGCLQHLSESVQHGIQALGGSADEEELSAANGTVHPDTASSPMSVAATEAGAAKRHTRTGARPRCVDSRMLAARLEAICKETGTSVQEVKQLLGTEDGFNGGPSAASMQGGGKPVKLSDVLPFIRAKMQELQEVKAESERMLSGLNRAFSDDDDSVATQRSLKPKQKPLPAFEHPPEAGLRLMQQETKRRKKKASRRPGDFASVLQNTKATVQERIGDLRSLRLACRSMLLVLEGRLVKGDETEQPPAYGEALVAMLVTQIEDLKQALPETEEALAGYRSSPLNVTIGRRLHLLSDAVRSLKLERDSLKEDLARRGRQGNMLLNELDQEAKAVRAELARRRKEQERFTSDIVSASGEIDAQKRYSAELAAKLASLQHERNVLCDALVQTLRGLPGTPHRCASRAEMQRHLLAALKKEQGKLLTGYVEAALRSAGAHEQCLRDILHGSLDELRCSMAALRAQVTNCWDLHGRSMVHAAAQQFVETTDVLVLENSMLRPRAIEREQLKRDKEVLEAALADVKEAHADILARLERAEDENTQLRRAMRDAQMTRALTNAEDDDEGENQRSGQLPRTHSVDWERRMIDGATELTMNAVNSMSGASMSAVFGSIVEETLRIYSGVQHSLRSVEAAYETARGKDEREAQMEAEERLQELRELSESAEYLRTRLPVLYRLPYQCGGKGQEPLDR
ncbi:hypothetical protein JIQ42_03875 [Leishmania sp. Namibia]|uniref:hypothetical protein n=1 Tax=Leishmania sp. Namibia TaxID=2802991 RepID=UPI001B7B5A49|nr:hypothetical protein JIQ42_03875 [Leishmania sp. Namibia]